MGPKKCGWERSLTIVTCSFTKLHYTNQVGYRWHWARHTTKRFHLFVRRLALIMGIVNATFISELVAVISVRWLDGAFLVVMVDGVVIGVDLVIGVDQ